MLRAVKWLLERARYTMIVGVLALLTSSVAALAWGVVKTAKLLVGLVREGGGDHATAAQLVQIFDAYLIASGLLVFAFGLYELFIGELALPEWLVVRSIDELKNTLASIIVLVMAGAFVEHLVAFEDGQQTVLYAVSVALVGGLLVFFTRSKAH